MPMSVFIALYGFFKTVACSLNLLDLASFGDEGLNLRLSGLQMKWRILSVLTYSTFSEARSFGLIIQ